MENVAAIPKRMVVDVGKGDDYSRVRSVMVSGQFWGVSWPASMHGLGLALAGSKQGFKREARNLANGRA